MFISRYKKLQALLTLQERKQLPLLFLLILIGMLLETLGIGLVVPIIALMTQTNVLDTHPALQLILSVVGNPTQAQLVRNGMFALLGLYSIKSLYLFFMISKQNKFTFSIQASLSSRLFAVYLKQPWSFHLQRNSAQLIRNATIEVNLFSSLALQSGMGFITEGSVLLGIVVLLIMMEPMGAPIVIASLGLVAWGFHQSTRKYLRSLGLGRQYHEGMRVQHLQQGLGGVKDVKVLGRARDFINQYQVHSEASASISRKQKTLMALPRLWIELLAVGGLAMLVLVMLARGTTPEGLLPVLGLFAAAAFRVAPSVNRILGHIQNLNYSLPVINTLYEEMQLIDNTALPEQAAMMSFKNELRLERIVYRYKNADNVALKGVSLSIKPGSSVGFVGTSGGGKSTLVDVILGLLTPEQGYIKIDGVDIQSNLRGWQDQIGYVPQSIYLTDDTLRRNVAFGLPDELIDDQAVCRAIKSAQLEGYFNSLPQGMKTMVGERGVRLSGGQRQRIGIARALYHNPSVLVLDEATSALDMATEKGVMEAINALHGEKTLIIIAHRLSTVSNCDRVYQMEQGCIVKQHFNSPATFRMT